MRSYPMRVGIIIYGSLNTITGGYIYDSKLVEHLLSKGVTVKIFSQKKYDSLFKLIQNNFSTKLLNQIIEFSPDIILQDEMNFASLFLFNNRLKKISRSPIISIVHVLESNLKRSILAKLILRRIEKLYLKSVQGYIYNSYTTKLSVVSLIGKHDNSLVAYPGKDRITAKPMANFTIQCYHDKFRVIFIGNILYNKGLHLLIHALSKIETTLWELSVIGGLEFDRTYVKKILKIVAHFKLENNIKLLGLLDAEQLKTQLFDHHVLAVPSYYESYGIVYAEAMSAGLPIIATTSGGAKEIVTDSINGFLVTPGDISMIRNSIYKLIQNRALLKQMSYSSLATYQTMPCWDESMKRVYTFLSNLRS